MPQAKRFVVVICLILFCLTPCFEDAYDAKPKLIVILVFDQFRRDYLNRIELNSRQRTVGISFSKRLRISAIAITTTQIW